MMTPERHRIECQKRLAAALVAIENAQKELDEACNYLSPLCGGAKLYTMTQKMRDRTHEHWYRVQTFMYGGKYHLDELNVQAILDREAKAANVTPSPAESRKDQP